MVHGLLPLASQLAHDHPLRQVVPWRAAKLAHDLDDPETALAVLAPLLLDEADPFEHYPNGLDACVPLAQRMWRHHGYGRPEVRRLLERCSSSHAARGDRYLHHHLQNHLAWDLACAGDLGALATHLKELWNLQPRDLQDGPTRHPRAPDAATSVPWLQLDAARTALRAGTWAGDAELVELAEDAFEEAADDAGLERSAEYWFLEPIAMARLRLQRPDPDEYVGAWFSAAPKLEHPRAGYHRALTRGFASLATEPHHAANDFDDAVRQAHFGGFGAEWEIDPAVLAAKIRGAYPQSAHSLANSHGVAVFTAALGALEREAPTTGR